MPAYEIVADLWRITSPTPFAVGDVHAYLLLGDPITLFDNGLAAPASEQALDAALAEIGIRPADLAQIIVSHSHLDHFGQTRRLQAQSQAEVFAHENARGRITDLAGNVQRASAWGRDLLLDLGAPDDLQMLIEGFYAVVPLLAEPVAVDHSLGEGDVIRAGAADWRVLFCPGHSGDLICLYDPARRMLLGSDHLLAHISSNALIEPPPVGEERRKPLIDYWRSLERLCDLVIDLILPGHGDVVRDYRTLLAERRQRRDHRLDRIVALLDEGPLTGWQIVGGLFPKLSGPETFLGLSEVVGHIDMLQAQGRVCALDVARPIRYARASI